jgi:hypothetical protein
LQIAFQQAGNCSGTNLLLCSWPARLVFSLMPHASPVGSLQEPYPKPWWYHASFPPNPYTTTPHRKMAPGQGGILSGMVGARGMSPKAVPAQPLEERWFHKPCRCRASFQPSQGSLSARPGHGMNPVKSELTVQIR